MHLLSVIHAFQFISKHNFSVLMPLYWWQF